jgi:hypothetical protein
LYIRYREYRFWNPPLVPHVLGIVPDNALLLRPLRKVAQGFALLPSIRR